MQRRILYLEIGDCTLNQILPTYSFRLDSISLNGPRGKVSRISMGATTDLRTRQIVSCQRIPSASRVISSVLSQQSCSSEAQPAIDGSESCSRAQEHVAASGVSRTLRPTVAGPVPQQSLTATVKRSGRWADFQIFRGGHPVDWRN